MAGKFNESPYRPVVRLEPHYSDFTAESDLDYTNPYPCGVCGKSFKSRNALVTHGHSKRSSV